MEKLGFKYFRINEDLQERQYILDNCFRHLDDLGKGKGSGTPSGAPQYVVNAEKLSEAVLAFHETVCAVPLPDDDPVWKNSVFKYFKIHEDRQERHYILDNCFRHLDDLGKD